MRGDGGPVPGDAEFCCGRRIVWRRGLTKADGTGAYDDSANCTLKKPPTHFLSRPGSTPG